MAHQENKALSDIPLSALLFLHSYQLIEEVAVEEQAHSWLLFLLHLLQYLFNASR